MFLKLLMTQSDIGEIAFAIAFWYTSLDGEKDCSIVIKRFICGNNFRLLHHFVSTMNVSFLVDSRRWSALFSMMFKFNPHVPHSSIQLKSPLLKTKHYTSCSTWCSVYRCRLMEKSQAWNHLLPLSPRQIYSYGTKLITFSFLPYISSSLLDWPRQHKRFIGLYRKLGAKTLRRQLWFSPSSDELTVYEHCHG